MRKIEQGMLAMLVVVALTVLPVGVALAGEHGGSEHGGSTHSSSGSSSEVSKDAATILEAAAELETSNMTLSRELKKIAKKL
ncbi:MAG: hypothetical protein Q8R76_01395 [Candidatus Omnitrophota bacterium]|nr:hypothetical protein [Candidatus Omnitrophota bacterium]